MMSLKLQSDGQDESDEVAATVRLVNEGRACRGGDQSTRESSELTLEAKNTVEVSGEER